VPLLIVACFALQPTAASAATDVFCSPFVPHTIVVGDKVHDASCDAQTIQEAITNTVCPNTTIYLTAEETYSGQHLTIQGKSLSIVGSTATSCSAATAGAANAPASVPTAPVTTISGNGSQSVFDISDNGSTGSTVTFRYVEITGGGGDSNSRGGGINFHGSGSLTLDTTTVDLNHAGYGGGIEVDGGSADATLSLDAYSVIESNTASGNGGGINIEGFTDLIASNVNTLIGFNHAPSGNGGGVAIVGPAHAEIASPGYGTLAVLYGNDAARGGGISAAASNNFDTGWFKLYTTDPAQPVAVSGNFASQAGGGIYLKAFDQFLDGGASAFACVYDFRIDGNAAPDGAAIYAASDSSVDGSVAGSEVTLNVSNSFCGASPSVHCGAGVTCNTLDGNSTHDSLNHATPGSVILVEDNGYLAADRVAMRGNDGAHGILLAGPGTENTINTCLIADNAFSAETVQVEDAGGGGAMAIDNCTIANNMHNSGSVFRTGLKLTIDDSIIDQPVMASVSKIGSPAIFADNVLAADTTGLPMQPNIVQGEPIFRDEAGGDYHQQAFKTGNQVTASLGIDFAPPVVGDDRDLDGNPYDQDVSAVPDAFGVRDIGCYEAQPIADRLFGDAFGDSMSIVQ